MTAMELNFVREDIPKITRAGGSGREAEPWENHLASLKESDKAGQSFRVWDYEKRTSAMSRMTSVRERLIKAVPQENWQLAVRSLPDNPGRYGVYVAYLGTLSAEEIAEKARKRQERSDRVRAARAKSNGQEALTPSAKERVAAARATNKASK